MMDSRKAWRSSKMRLSSCRDVDQVYRVKTSSSWLGRGRRCDSGRALPGVVLVPTLSLPPKGVAGIPLGGGLFPFGLWGELGLVLLEEELGLGLWGFPLPVGDLDKPDLTDCRRPAMGDSGIELAGE